MQCIIVFLMPFENPLFLTGSHCKLHTMIMKGLESSSSSLSTLIFIASFVFLTRRTSAGFIESFWQTAPPKGVTNDSDSSVEDHRTKVDDSFVRDQLAAVQCPQRPDRQLDDYWRCIWRTSLSAEGHEQDAWFEVESVLKDSTSSYQAQIDQIRKQGNTFWETRNKTKVGNTRQKRQIHVTVPPNLDKDVRDVFETTRDALRLLRTPETVKACQVNDLKPGINLREFLRCLFVNNRYDDIYLPNILKNEFTDSKVNIINSYDNREFTTLLVDDPEDDFIFKMEYKFDLFNVRSDGSDDLSGADPFNNYQLSPFRYKYDNLNSNQRQPGWSYSGSDGPPKWHQLDIRKFYIPLKDSSKLKDISLNAEFVQTYPGLGEIAEHEKEGTFNLEAPLEIRWNKDSGFHAYTRFPISLLDGKDLEYYKFKNTVPESVTWKPGARAIGEIISAIDQFVNRTQDSLLSAHDYNRRNPDIPPENEIPFIDVYRAFLRNHYRMDITQFKSLVAKAQGLDSIDKVDMYPHYEVGRLLIHAYSEAVRAHEVCLKTMLDHTEYPSEGEDLHTLITKARALCDPPKFPFESLSNHSMSVEAQYFGVGELYHSYFGRKAARQRYSLPVYPIQFPICKHPSPSPLNIITSKGRKSTLRSYVFGKAGYMLHKMIVYFPVDASNLLGVGILGSRRIDNTSPRLEGGVIKGQPLSFQVMYIRFGRDWKAIGSEHHLEGKGAPVELQLVFSLGGTADAEKYWHTLARVQNQMFQFRGKLVVILSVLVDVLETDEDVQDRIQKEGTNQDPYVFEPLAQAAYHYRKQREVFPNQPEPRGYKSMTPVFRLIDFLPQRKTKFFTYRGSLSWPPCFGYVIWSVFEQRLYMSKRQFDQFAKIPAFGISDDNLASNNFRRFSDIYVEAENDPKLSYKQRETMIRMRTVDRQILEGEHDPEAAIDSEVKGVVSDDFYNLPHWELDVNFSSARGTRVHFLIFILVAAPASFLKLIVSSL